MYQLPGPSLCVESFRVSCTWNHIKLKQAAFARIKTQRNVFRCLGKQASFTFYLSLCQSILTIFKRFNFIMFNFLNVFFPRQLLVFLQARLPAAVREMRPRSSFFSERVDETRESGGNRAQRPAVSSREGTKSGLEKGAEIEPRPYHVAQPSQITWRKITFSLIKRDSNWRKTYEVLATRHF